VEPFLYRADDGKDKQRHRGAADSQKRPGPVAPEILQDVGEETEHPKSCLSMKDHQETEEVRNAQGEIIKLISSCVPAYLSLLSLACLPQPVFMSFVSSNCPFSNLNCRRAMAAARGSCVTIRNVVPSSSFRRRNKSRTCSVVSASRSPVG